MLGNVDIALIGREPLAHHLMRLTEDEERVGIDTANNLFQTTHFVLTDDDEQHRAVETRIRPDRLNLCRAAVELIEDGTRDDVPLLRDDVGHLVLRETELDEVDHLDRDEQGDECI